MVQKQRKLQSILLTMILCISMLWGMPVKAENSMNVYRGDGFTITFCLVNTWETAYQAEISVENTGSKPIKNWYLRFELEDAIKTLWNSSIDAHIEDCYIIKNAQWNQNISPGDQVTFGFIADGRFSGFPKDYEILGESEKLAKKDYIIRYETTNEWNTGFTGAISITNNTEKTLENWTLAFDFSGELDQIWDGFLLLKQDTHYMVTNAEYNSYIPAGQTVTFGFSGKKNQEEAEPAGYELHVYNKAAGIDDNTQTTTEQITTEQETTEEEVTEEVTTEQISENIDSDGDGLTDYEELQYTWTDPFNVDSDGNGIDDGKEDMDRDGLSNREELDLGTEPFNADTDRDGLTDYEEIYTYHTNPLQEDTDSDGLSDYEDILLGFSPLLQDTDGNGILDSEEKVYQTVSKAIENPGNPGVTEVSVSLEAKGNVKEQIRICDMYGIDTLSSDVVGLIGVPVEIRCDVEFEEAKLTFHYDENALGGAAEEDLAVMWYDKENAWYEILDKDSCIDTEQNTVTYTTTHFSTYMLVNCKEWHDAWKENINYKEGLPSGKNTPHDYYFLVDFLSAGTDKERDDIKTVVNTMVDNMSEEDHMGYTSIPRHGHLTTHMLLPIDEHSLEYLEGTNYWREISYSYPIYVVEEEMWSIINAHRCEYEPIVIMVGSRSHGYSQEFADRCKARGIKIYVINVDTETSEIMMKYAQRTGGEYYDVYGIGDCENIVATVVGAVNEIDTTDKDDDGLYDIYETAGMRLPNGRIIYTDPELPDTDFDGLTDAQETGIIYNIEKRYIGLGETKAVAYFKMRSYPDSKDSDGDNYYDMQDKKPLTADSGVETIAELHNKFFEDEYLRIREGAEIYAGGSQGWWQSSVDTNKIRDLSYMQALKEDKYYRLKEIGCGTIAMSDLELYMYFQNEDYQLESDVEIDKTEGFCDTKVYKQYIEDMYSGKYEISSSYVDRKLGLPVWDMEQGLGSFLTRNQHKYKCVQWAPYSMASQKDKVLKDIERMLRDNVPVVFSYYNMDEDEKISLYLDMEKVIKGKFETGTNSHYMTITGLYKHINTDTLEEKYILRVVSWGTEYYIDFNEYVQKLSYFSNILSAYEGGW